MQMELKSANKKFLSNHFTTFSREYSMHTSAFVMSDSNKQSTPAGSNGE
jgi:hypothetical protein